MLNYQSYDHLTAIRLSAGNGFVVLVWSPMGNIVTVSGYCREALSAFQAQRARDSGGVKTPFSFFSAIPSKASVVPVPVLNQGFCSCMLSTALLVTLQDSEGEALGAPWGDVSTSVLAKPTSSPGTPWGWNPLLAADTSMWELCQQSHYWEELLGLANWFFKIHITQYLLRNCPAGWCHVWLEPGSWAVVTGTGLAGFYWRHFTLSVCLIGNSSVIQGRKWETLFIFWN